MNIQDLIDSLKSHRDAIDGEAIQKMDFDQLEKDLSQSVQALSSFDKTEELCQRLLADFKSQIKRMSLAVSRAKGDPSSCSLVERLLESPDLSFDDLLFLREKVKEEFNHSFPSSPRSRVMIERSGSNFTISEFKTGVKT
jgi:hypothetical protein